MCFYFWLFILTAHSAATESDADGDSSGEFLTMEHFVAYIGIIRCLLGNEFIFEADVVDLPNPSDRHWINQHIKPHRPGIYVYGCVRTHICIS